MAGGFWGGLAEGVESGQGIAQRQEALGLQRQQIQQQADLKQQEMQLMLKKFLGESADKVIEKNVGEIGNLLTMAEKAVENNKIDAAMKLREPIQAMIAKVQRVAGPLGYGDRIPDFMPRFDAIFSLTPTPGERGGVKALERAGELNTANANNVPSLEGKAQGDKTLAAAPGEAAADVLKINTTAAPKAAAAAQSTAATTGAQLQTEAANAPAIQTVAQARSTGQTAGEIQGKNANLPALANVEQTISFIREQAKQAAEGNGKQFDRERKLSDDVRATPQFKQWSDVAPIITGMRDAAQRGTRASDLNLVYGLAKIFDPGSVVREGEMIMVRNAGALPDQLLGYINSLNGGSGLTPATRKAVMAEAEGRAQGYSNAWEAVRSQTERTAQEFNLNPKNVIPDVLKYEPPQAAPKIQSPLKKKYGLD